MRHPGLREHRGKAVRAQKEKDMIEKDKQSRKANKATEKAKPTEEEQMVKSAIMKQKQIGENALAREHRLRELFSRYKVLPPGPEKQKALQDALVLSSQEDAMTVAGAIDSQAQAGEVDGMKKI